MQAKRDTYELSIGSTLPVLRYDWMSGSEYWEVLSQDESHIDLNRLENNAVPLLFNHDEDKHLGNVLNVSTDGDRSKATVKFGSGELAQEKEKDLNDGILTSTSIRYRVNQLEKTGEVDGIPVMTAINWELVEVSLVTVPADPTVGYQRSITVDADKTVNLPEYTIPVLENIRGTSETDNEYDLESYLPANCSNSGAFVAALEAANRAIKRSALDKTQKQKFIDRNVDKFDIKLRSLYMATQKPEEEKITPKPVEVEGLEQLRSELSEARKLGEQERAAREELSRQVANSNRQNTYILLRSQYEKLRDVTFQITPDQFTQEFSASINDDLAKIANGEITDDHLKSLGFLYERFSKLESRNIGKTAARYADNEGDADKDLEAVKKIAEKKARDFNRTLAGASQVL